MFELSKARGIPFTIISSPDTFEMNQDFVVASQKDVEMHLSIFFGSDRSSRNANLCSSIRSPVRLAQSSQRAIREHSENTQNIQGAIREQSETTQRAILTFKSESYSRSLKYCVLLTFFKKCIC